MNKDASPHANQSEAYRKLKFKIALISNGSLLIACMFIIIPIVAFSGHMAFANFNAFIDEASVSPAIVKDWQTDRISVLFIGDMMFDRGVRTKILADGEETVFASTTRLLASRFDIAIGNLEGPITSNRSKTVDSSGRAIPGFSFTFPTSTASMLKRSGIDIVSLANNHADNFGSAGFSETAKWLASEGVWFFGNPTNTSESLGGNPSPSDISTVRCIDNSLQSGKLNRPYCIGLIGYHGLVENGEQEILMEIQKLANIKKAGAAEDGVNTSLAPDYIVVFPHWGNEYQKTPTAEQKRLAHAWIDAGADIVVGAHPHIVQSVETYKGKPIFYSLGNYMFDQYFSYDTTHGLTIGLDFVSNEGEDGNISDIHLKKIKLMPIDITGTRVRMTSDLDRTKMLNEIVRISDGFIATSTKEQILKSGEIAFD